jgi:putative transposase
MIRRKFIRLKNYDYSQDGAYFITICAHNRECIFGKINGGIMIKNKLGVIVYNEWKKSAEIRKEIILDEFIVMPNHLHGVVFISRDGRPPAAPTLVHIGIQKKSIGSLVGGFKSTVTKQINQIDGTYSRPIWQRNYYEHIIRNETMLSKIREYIINNPLNWDKDKINPINF